MAAKNNLIEQECLAAHNVKNILEQSKVKQVIYLAHYNTIPVINNI
ncbi:MAG: hypothetical protein ACL7BU_04905 [Candidatus Phlomobacter fragariae]